MDTGELYIKMSDCPEIQALWKPQIGDYIGGDWFIDNQDNMGKTFLGIVQQLKSEGHNDCISTGGSIFWAIESAIWLPLLGQLYEIYNDGKVGRESFLMILQFTDWFLTKGEIDKFTSFEQLTLAFLMRKFNKVWEEGWHNVAT